MQEQLSFLLENYFDHTRRDHCQDKTSMPDENFVWDWQGYINDITQQGFLVALKKRLVQLNFPVREGMSKNHNYRLATRRGADIYTMPEATGVELEEPAGIEVYLYQTFAGRIPVIQVDNRSDFETLVRVFSCRNEPVPIPSSMGACMIKGYNNWDRVKKYKVKWQKKNGHKNIPDLLWKLEFEKLKTRTELYRDRFLILSNKEYSNVSAGMMGMPADKWQRLSLVIRREHESTHYCTLRFWGSARNDLLDELIADYMGIVAAAGRYRASWFLCFMGLENYPDFRPGGRLTNYLKDRELSDEAFSDLKRYIKDAAQNLESFSERYAPDIYKIEGKYKMLCALTKMNLVELASKGPTKYY